MKKALLLLLSLPLLLTSCQSTGESAAASETGFTEKSISIFFYTTEGGIATIESEETMSFLTIPGLQIDREPVSSYISGHGEPIFVSTRDAINIKVYQDKVMFMRGNTIEYVPWFFTKSPKEFYYKF